jgi:hypothetical protein
MYTHTHTHAYIHAYILNTGELRLELQALLSRKIRHPRLDLFKEGGELVSAVVRLLGESETR